MDNLIKTRKNEALKCDIRRLKLEVDVLYPTGIPLEISFEV